MRRLACHEAGHAVVATVLRQRNGNLEKVERVSIQPRGDEWTRTLYLRGDDETYSMSTRARMLDRLQVRANQSCWVAFLSGTGRP